MSGLFPGKQSLRGLSLRRWPQVTRARSCVLFDRAFGGLVYAWGSAVYVCAILRRGVTSLLCCEPVARPLHLRCELLARCGSSAVDSPIRSKPLLPTNRIRHRYHVFVHSSGGCVEGVVVEISNMSR